MKQLIQIPARFLKKDDLVFDFKHRDLQKIDYVGKEDKNGNHTEIVSNMHNIHVSYGVNSASADNFYPNDQVTIMIDTDNLKISKPDNIGYR